MIVEAWRICEIEHTFTLDWIIHCLNVDCLTLSFLLDAAMMKSLTNSREKLLWMKRSDMNLCATAGWFYGVVNYVLSLMFFQSEHNKMIFLREMIWVYLIAGVRFIQLSDVFIVHLQIYEVMFSCRCFLYCVYWG